MEFYKLLHLQVFAMSSNALKDQILVILKDIVENKKDENTIVGELQDLLIKLRNITVFDGLKLFTEVFESKEEYESQKIKEFLTLHLEDIEMFPSLYKYVKNLNIQVQDSVVLEETESISDVSPPVPGAGGGMSGPPSVPVNSVRMISDEKPMPPPPSPSPKMPILPASPKRSMTKEKKKAKSSFKMAEKERELDELVVEEEEDELDDSSTGDKRSILVDYYSRMNINQVYDFTVKIDKKMLEAKQKQSDFLTGEQREQVTEEIEVVKELPIEIELNIPGCMVSPTTHYVSPDKPSALVTFFVTPYVKLSKRKAQVVIGQKKLDKKTISLEVSVIDRRIMKLFSIIGVLVASVPSLWQYIFGVDMNLQLYYTLSHYSSFIQQGIIVPIEIGLGGIITLLSLITFKSYSSKRSSFLSTQSI